MEQFIKEIAELKTEMKYISKTLSKVEKVLENQNVMLEKQNVANKRILKLEDNIKEHSGRIRILEDWKLKAITYTTIIATIGSTII
jgi:hypothetical protein